MLHMLWASPTHKFSVYCACFVFFCAPALAVSSKQTSQNASSMKERAADHLSIAVQNTAVPLEMYACARPNLIAG